MTQQWLQIGELYREHGVRGEAKLYLYSGSDDNLRAAKNCKLIREDGEELVCRVVKVQEYGRHYLTRLDVFKSPEEIVPWRKAGVFIPREVVEVEDDEMLDADWQGYTFADEAGTVLGEIVSLEHAPQPLWRVLDEKGEEHLVPYVLSWVVSLDKKKKIVKVSLPEGLWHLD